MAPELVAFDGWSLAYDPFSPAAIHLLTLISDSFAPERFYIFVPSPSPHLLPEQVRGEDILRQLPTRSRLIWEQAHLPQQAARLGATELQLFTPSPALVSPVPVTYSPTQWNDPPKTTGESISERLRRSLAAGGMGNIRRLDWPSDLPVPHTSLPVQVVAPRVHAWFRAGSMLPSIPAAFQTIQRPGLTGLDLTAAPFFLYTGPAQPGALRLLLAGWSWAAPALGEDFQLVLPNLPGSAQNLVAELSAGQAFAASLVPLKTSSLAELAYLYRQAAAVIQLGPSQPWGDACSLALAAGRPLIAIEEPLTASRVGPAGFLIPDKDPRLLGAALVTLGSDESLAQTLIDAALQRSAAWL